MIERKVITIKRIFKALFGGYKHLKNRRPCQDYAAYRLSSDGVPVLCLSDGAGGARYAELASRGNVDAVLNFFQKTKVSDFLSLEKKERIAQIVTECNRYLGNVAARYNIDEFAQLSATLVFVIVTDETIYCGHIGDGIIAAKTNDSVHYLSKPVNIDSASNRTHFTCELKAEKYYQESIFNTSDYSSILLCSDGPYNDISRVKDLSNAFASLLNDVENGIISNDIDFSSRIMNMSEIYDDWSILAASIEGRTIVEKVPSE